MILLQGSRLPSRGGCFEDQLWPVERGLVLHSVTWGSGAASKRGVTGLVLQLAQDVLLNKPDTITYPNKFGTGGSWVS